jgi:hypothetical protein
MTKKMNFYWIKKGDSMKKIFNTNDYYTAQETAKLLSVCEQRIRAKLKQGHFPNATYSERNRRWEIPLEDVEKEIKRKQAATAYHN